MKAPFSHTVCLKKAMVRASRALFPLLFAAALLPASSGSLSACTLWAAAGKTVFHGGTLVAKNRDWTPEQQAIKICAPPAGYHFLGLYPVRPGKTSSPVAGVNSKGLVVVAASAGSLPRGQRRQGGRGLTGHLLASFASVAEVMAEAEAFSRTHPAFYLIADRFRTALIEVGPRGTYAIRTADEGFLIHTNHYVTQELAGMNAQVGRSSRKRLARIKALLDDHQGPLTMEDFIEFSLDGRDGPDDSLWRTGSGPQAQRTLATWIVSLPPDGPPELWASLLNPGGGKKTGRLSLDAAFWDKRPGWVFQ